MLAKVLTCAVMGLEGSLVEVDIASGGLPNFLVVGLPDDAVKEARERVRAALKNSGHGLSEQASTRLLRIAFSTRVCFGHWPKGRSFSMLIGDFGSAFVRESSGIGT